MPAQFTAPSRPLPWLDAILVFVIIFGAIHFNFFLAVLNANGLHVSSRYVVLSELFLYILAGLVILRNYDPSMLRYFALIAFIGFNFLILCLTEQQFVLKIPRDILIAPIFLLVGIIASRGNFLRIFIIIQISVFMFLLLEAFSVDIFAKYVNPRLYYINSRGFSDASFWNEGSDLYISATRGQGRYLLESFGLHRMSSVFLEPVSLGNYAIAGVIVSLAFWRHLGLVTRFFMFFSTVALMLGSDGRLASSAMALVILLWVFHRLVPRYLNLLYPLATFGFAAVLVVLFGFDSGRDNFEGRIAKSVEMFASLDVRIFTGDFSMLVPDSGYTYLVASSGLIAILVWWTVLMSGADQRNPTARFIVHAVSLYFALTLSVSSTAFTIKTAGIMWCLVGIAAGLSMRTRSKVGEARPLVEPRPGLRWSGGNLAGQPGPVT